MKTKSEKRVALGLRNFKSGMWAETLAIILLNLKGYRIIERRLRSSLGEIDIIARRGKVIAVVEVKSSASRFSAMEALSGKQMGRIEEACSLFVSRNPSLAGLDIRFDLVLVSPFSFPRHIINAWRPL